MNSYKLESTNNVVVYAILGEAAKNASHSKEELQSFGSLAEKIEVKAKKINFFAGSTLLILGLTLLAASFFLPFTWPVLLILAPFGIAWVVSKVAQSQANGAKLYFRNPLPEKPQPQKPEKLTKEKQDQMDKVMKDPRYSVFDLYKERLTNPPKKRLRIPKDASPLAGRGAEPHLFSPTNSIQAQD